MILILTSWPSPQVSTKVAWSDKIVHFSVYAVLGHLVARALAAPRSRATLLAAVAGMCVFGMLDEVHQAWIPGRDASIADWMADLLGATVGLLVSHHLLSLAPTRQDLPT